MSTAALHTKAHEEAAERLLATIAKRKNLPFDATLPPPLS